MKTSKFLLTLLSVSLFAAKTFAQYIPTHDHYVTYIADGKSFSEYFPTWEPGTALSEDENFFISRVKKQPRFINRNTQARAYTDNDNARKFSLCTPMGVSDTYWQTLPRYVLDGDNFSMWSYLDSQGGWSQSWIRNVGSYSDICHKNGVANSGGVLFFDSWGGDNTSSNAVITMLNTKVSGKFKYVEKFIKFLRYYGIDGVTFNPEGTIPSAAIFQLFLQECMEKAPEYGWEFHVSWYNANGNYGGLDLGNSHYLNKNNQNWFVRNKKPVTDIFFLNYEWSNSLASSLAYADSLLEGSSTNVYAGYDIQGNWMARGSWKEIATTKAGIILWGNHTTDMIYQNSTEQGSSDEAVQACYQKKLEEVFSGGNHNPANTPDITDGIKESGSSSMKKFHGIAALMPARSCLQTLPFVTRFSLGNGKVFRSEGKPTFNQKWYSISTQDYLPTWRWWITNDDEQVPTDEIACDFTFEDSWWAGSCVKFSGKTAQSNVRLFKTNFNVGATDKIDLVYKVRNGNGAKAQLFWSFVGSEKTLHTCDITATTSVNGWSKLSATAQQMGMTGNVALLGIRFENTAENYEMLVGELGIVPVRTFNPVKPTITKAEFLQRTYNSLSYKLIWDCGKSAASQADASIPTYNEDVDTWYFEVYSQMQGGEPMLEGATTSWAHYIVGGKSRSDVTRYRIGVRAVAPDGVTASEIAWTDYQEVPSVYVEGIAINKNIIKAGEEFRVQYQDPGHPAAKWHIVEPLTNRDVITGEIISTEEIVAKPTASTTASTHWYVIQFKEKGYVLEAQGDGAQVKTATMNKSSNAQLWKFEGDDTNGYKITSKNGQVLYTNTTALNGMFYSSASAANNNLFVFVASTNASYAGAMMIAPKANTGVFMNQWGNAGEGKYLGLWNDASDVNQPMQFILPVDAADATEPSTGLTTSIAKTGSYDVVIRDDNGLKYYRGFVQITAEETGALPVVNDFTADKTMLTSKGDKANVTFDVDRWGEGTVSRGMVINDPYMFEIPKEALPNAQQTYSIGLWFQPDHFAHSKYGTNLINKRCTDYKWPHNNWGAFWVHIWPETYYNSQKVIENNIVSYTMYNNDNKSGTFCGNSNLHEIPNMNCNSGTYGMTEGTWTHIMISYDGTTQRIFYNGKKVAENAATFNEYRDAKSGLFNECATYIGGSNVYHSGMFGIIDDIQVWHKALTTENEVQEAMKGYYGKKKPDGLAAYWSLENLQKKGEGDEAEYYFPNEVEGNEWNAHYVYFNGAGGESTAGATTGNTLPNNNVTGCPALPGTLEIATTATLTPSVGSGTTRGLEATVAQDQHAGTLTAVYDGSYDVALTISNPWGSATLTKADYIVVNGAGDGIHDMVPELAEGDVDVVALNGGVGLIFTTDGTYSVNVYNLSGQEVASKTLSAKANQVNTIIIQSPTPLPLIKVLQDGKIIKTFKLRL